MRIFPWKVSWQHSEEAVPAPPNPPMKPMPAQALMSSREWIYDVCIPLL
jgi:hypothetical protein